MLDKEFNWYIVHQTELVEKYNGKHLLIKDENVFGSYNSSLEAFVEGKKTFEKGTFLIQLCTPGEKDYTKYFRSRVIIA